MPQNPVLAVAVLALSLFASAPSSAKAYKCIVDGKTVYQDHPCAGPAPSATVAAAPTAVVVPPTAHRSAPQLFDEIQMVERHLRELEASHQAEARIAAPRLAAMDPKARQAETLQMQARWQQPVRVQQQKLDRLKAELRAQCPGGARMRANRFECLP